MLVFNVASAPNSENCAKLVVKDLHSTEEPSMDIFVIKRTAVLHFTVTRKSMRRRKCIVPEAFVATGNKKNEYGRSTPVRTMTFTSSSSDVLQAAVRCIADYEFQKWCVPDVDFSER